MPLTDLRPWPVAHRPFDEEAFGSWLGRIASRYALSIAQLWEISQPGRFPALTNAGWILFAPLPEDTLKIFATLARVEIGHLVRIQTPSDWMIDRAQLPVLLQMPGGDSCRCHRPTLKAALAGTRYQGMKNTSMIWSTFLRRCHRRRKTWIACSRTSANIDSGALRHCGTGDISAISAPSSIINGLQHLRRLFHLALPPNIAVQRHAGRDGSRYSSICMRYG
ncbi:hypothetical protein LJ656_30080 [Paraburkholderia sp. MMS20-SJTR3]|uniref:TniQ protein n=1 Tax=Paraburkholderia sejongensis TaxID=2886946 RepID=A0ABS8K4E7_9BURK|nr:hypothetical protein [Paraburkholderia sp. MMS20-SJTR3]MCC8396840.1 hypothetical protein [Paraburkholderia sp. MMS20-SJTR3]